MNIEPLRMALSTEYAHTDADKICLLCHCTATVDRMNLIFYSYISNITSNTRTREEILSSSNIPTPCLIHLRPQSSMESDLHWELGGCTEGMSYCILYWDIRNVFSSGLRVPLHRVKNYIIYMYQDPNMYIARAYCGLACALASPQSSQTYLTRRILLVE